MLFLNESLDDELNLLPAEEKSIVEQLFFVDDLLHLFTEKEETTLWVVPNGDYIKVLEKYLEAFKIFPNNYVSIKIY